MNPKTIIKYIGAATAAGLALYGLECTGVMSAFQEHNLAVSDRAWIGQTSDFFYAAMVEGSYLLRAGIDLGIPVLTGALTFKSLEKIVD
ncbi:hypothetical protein HY837_04415 [archaeon]|nr:hypothetical protein [archaeon]